MIGSSPGQPAVKNTGLMQLDGAAVKDFVQGSHGQEGWERAETACRGRGQVERVWAEAVPAEGIAPVVVIAGDQGGQMGRGEEERMVEQVAGLPAALSFAQAQMEVDQVQGALGSRDDDELGAARFAP